MERVQTVMVAWFGPFNDFLILTEDLGIMLLHPEKPQDYQVLGGNHDQERDGLHRKCTDLGEKRLGA